MSMTTPAEGTGLRAVVAEDETLIRLDLVEVLTGAGYEVVAEAGDGAAAVAAVPLKFDSPFFSPDSPCRCLFFDGACARRPPSVPPSGQ